MGRTCIHSPWASILLARALVLVGAGNPAANKPPLLQPSEAPPLDSLSDMLSQLRFPMAEGEPLTQSTNLSFHSRCGKSWSCAT